MTDNSRKRSHKAFEELINKVPKGEHKDLLLKILNYSRPSMEDQQTLVAKKENPPEEIIEKTRKEQKPEPEPGIPPRNGKYFIEKHIADNVQRNWLQSVFDKAFKNYNRGPDPLDYKSR